ncbi:MAG: hypothetical protein CM15mP103_01030 [Gammaproteobacteria bacterium]|nr:MAG: hypothetical protein CM15mP103_01030 [Gammaproteobacteria bacterium]
MTQHDPALLSAALAGAEQALNQAIALAPTRIRNSMLSVARSGDRNHHPGSHRLYRDGHRYRGQTDGPCERDTDAFVRGTLEDFAALATSDDPQPP